MEKENQKIKNGKLCRQHPINEYILFSSIGRPKHIRVMAGALEGDVFVGPRAEEHRGLLSIRYPMEHGIVTDWNDMERIWNYIYSKVQFFEKYSYELCGRHPNSGAQ